MAGSSNALQLADAMLQSKARHAEYLLSVVRAVFCATVAVRFVILHADTPIAAWIARALHTLPATLAALAFSLWVSQRVHRVESAQEVLRLLRLSVWTDAGLCFVALLSNVLWPFPTYNGLLFQPDVAALLVMIAAAGFRVWSTLAVLGAIANTASFMALVALDASLNPQRVQYGGDLVLLLLLVIGSIAALSIAAARRTEGLVRDSAESAVRRERAERGHRAVVREHHDARSLLSTALLRAARLSPDAERAPDAEVVQALRTDLMLLRTLLLESATRPVPEATEPGRVSDPPALEQLDVRGSLSSLRGALERAVRPMRVRWALGAEPLTASVAGGERALLRLLLNLLCNAQEGDGARGASQVEVRLERTDAGGLRLVAQDDGPGLRDEPDERAGRAGTGHGLPIVRSIVAASGGTVEWTSTSLGTRVTISLPPAPPAPAADPRALTAGL